MELKEIIEKILEAGLIKAVISKPSSKTQEYKKAEVMKKEKNFQLTCYTEKQAFHKNLQQEELAADLISLLEKDFRQLNAWTEGYEHIVMISKKGECHYKKKKNASVSADSSHNRKKNYIIPEGVVIPPLVDMGIYTSEGRVVSSMYDKYRQINRFLELIDDGISELGRDELRIIDFGCGKSYLTFILYYYLTEIKGLKAKITGLDLKADVIKKCNETAKRYGYSGLSFEVGDINGYSADNPVDMVITLHACDTATDYALFNAVSWKASLIYSVPCCQHELNAQLNTENLELFSRYGIIKERLSALATDAIRANLLEYAGYRTQLIEFIDFEHTPKNILIRAVRRPVTPTSVKKKALTEVKSVCEEFGFDPSLLRLFNKAGLIK